MLPVLPFLIGGSTEQSGQKIQLSGNQSDRFTIDCDSIKREC